MKARLTHVVLAVALVGGDPLHGELGHAEVLGHRHRRPLLSVLVPLQKELLRRLRNCKMVMGLLLLSYSGHLVTFC